MYEAFRQASHVSSTSPRHQRLAAHLEHRSTRKRARVTSPTHNSTVDSGTTGSSSSAPLYEFGHRYRPHGPALHSKADPDFRIGLDFGTTFSCLAWWKKGMRTDIVLTVDNFRHNLKSSHGGAQIPSEICYLVPKDPDHTPRGKYICGYEVEHFFRLAESDPQRLAYQAAIRVERMKLVFYDDPLAQGYRAELHRKLKQLRDAGLIKNNEDPVTHMLTYYFINTKRLLTENHGYTEEMELTFMVPVFWDLGANVRMQKCVIAAMRAAGLGSIASSVDPSLFMVNEAEAASMNALGSGLHNFLPGETFLLGDCGGGTTDWGMYEVTNQLPLRLTKEIIPPAGAWIGSSDLNERMRMFAYDNLHNQTYLCDPNEDNTITSIIERCIIPTFEMEYKRMFRLGEETNGKFPYTIPGLKQSRTNPRLMPGKFTLSYNDMEQLFMPSLKRIRDLMETQITEAREGGIDVDKVVLVGGFGDSEALRKFLRDHLDTMHNCRYVRNGMNSIKLVITPEFHSATAVGKGGVMLAQDKRHGPKRSLRLSYGVRRHHEWDPDSNSDVMRQKVEVSQWDNQGEIRNTILWVLKCGQGELQTEHRETFESVHCFAPKERVWKASEILYTSETCVDDFYRRSHSKNKGKTTEVGRIKFDLTHLKRKNLVKLTKPAGHSKGKQRYEVTVLIDIEVVDRNLKFTVRWPAVDSGDVVNRESFSMVAAFEPGTA